MDSSDHSTISSPRHPVMPLPHPPIASLQQVIDVRNATIRFGTFTAVARFYPKSKRPEPFGNNFSVADNSGRDRIVDPIPQSRRNPS